MSARREHDFRLVPAALFVWCASLLGELALAPGLALAVVACVLGAAAGIVWWRRGHSSRSSGAAVVVLIACVVGIVASVVAAVRLADRESSATMAAARAEGFVRIDGTVEQRPRAIQGSRDLVIVRVDIETITWRGETTPESVSVVVMGDATRWTDAIAGVRVRISGRAHVPDHPSSVVAVVIDSGVSQVTASAPRWSALAESVRGRLKAAAAVNEPDTAGLLVAMVDGDTTGIGGVVQDEFRRSGLAHLLAVSGANVAIVAGVALWLARFIRAAFPMQVASAAAALAMFMVIAGPDPSVLRAAGMGVVMLVGLASGRPRAAIPSLSSTVIVLIIWLPDLSLSIGFVLSVAATGGIVLLGARWTDRWSRGWIPRPLAAAFAVAASAAVVTLPVIVVLLPMINLGSVLANVVAAPAVPFVTICGVGAAVFAPILMPVAEFCCFVAGFAVRWIAHIASFASDAEALHISLPAGILATAVVLAALALTAVIWRLTRRRAMLRTGIVGVVLGALVLSIPVRCAVNPWPPSGWVIAACDVGQGDAVLANVGDGTAVLFDTGPDPRCLPLACAS